MSLPPSVAGKEVCVANVLVFTLCQPWRRAALAAGETFRQEALAFVMTPADTAITLHCTSLLSEVQPAAVRFRAVFTALL